MSKLKLGKTGASRTRGKEKEHVSPQEVRNIKQCYTSAETDFMEYLFHKGFSASTVRRYMGDNLLFGAWLEKENVQLATVSYADVLHYIQGKKGTVKQRTISMQINSLKHYFNFLCQQGEVSDNPTLQITIRGVKRRELYTILSKQELEALYHDFEFTIDEKQKNKNWYKASILAAARNKVILGFLIYQGLNTTEIERLTVQDLKLREGKIFIAGTRRSNERELVLEALQIMDLMEYILKTRLELLALTGKESERLLISIGNSVKINNTLVKLIEKLKEQNSKVQSLKQIRTSVITHWLKLHNLRQVQHMSGHRYVSSTESYLVNDLDDLQEDITKFHPIG